MVQQTVKKKYIDSENYKPTGQDKIINGFILTENDDQPEKESDYGTYMVEI